MAGTPQVDSSSRTPDISIFCTSSMFLDLTCREVETWGNPWCMSMTSYIKLIESVDKLNQDKLQKAASGVTDEPPTEAGGGGGGSGGGPRLARAPSRRRVSLHAVPLRIGWGPEDAERLKRKRAELAEAEGDLEGPHCCRKRGCWRASKMQLLTEVCMCDCIFCHILGGQCMCTIDNG